MPYCAASGCLNKAEGLFCMSTSENPETISAPVCSWHRLVYTFVAAILNKTMASQPPTADPRNN